MKIRLPIGLVKKTMVFMMRWVLLVGRQVLRWNPKLESTHKIL